MTDPQAVRRRPALVADLLLRAEVLLGVGVGRFVDGLLEGGEGDHLLGLGLALDHDADALVGLSSDENANYLAKRLLTELMHII